ncbi:MAG: Gfo/Idh/MocA family oxidoreductase [Chloroflexi bacterium]|nr:Gfo/Idh/MocA family oxidoreductase [Chloroflexota bacterium]
MPETIGVGVVGCGHVSEQYFEGFQRMPLLDVIGCFDIDESMALRQSEQYAPLRVFRTIEDLLSCDEIQIVLNITPPKAHATVTRMALEGGKHVYSEKPLAPTLEEAQDLVDLATQRGLRLACAPDTILGSGLQTTRKLLDDGWIGEPVGVGAYFLSHGIEHFHPSPASFYAVGAGPLLDVGPYYLSAMVNLLGPVARVSALSRTTFPMRTAKSKFSTGSVIAVETPTYISASLEFESGIIGTLVATFDVWATRLPFIELYGTEGTISSPDPDSWTGEPEIRRYGAEEGAMLDLQRDVRWAKIPPSHPTDATRGIGVEDLAASLLTGQPHRASAVVALHVLDIALSIGRAAREGRTVDVSSTCDRPAPLTTGIPSRPAIDSGTR